MKCPNCGQEAPEGAAFCPYCAAPLQEGTSAPPTQPAQAPPTPAYAVPAVPTRTSGLAIGGLVTGILGIIISCVFWPIGVILGLAGLVLGILGLNEIKKQPGMQGKEMAIIAIVLGALGLVIALLAVVGVIALITMGPRISSIFGEIYNSLQ